MKLAIVLVHYHTPRLAQRACEALLADAERSQHELELVLVDNGSREQDSRLLSSLPARRLDPGRNLGYAGGANLGVRETSAERVVVMNPDVIVLPGCLEALGSTLEAGVAVAGPRFYWDAERRFLLPPTERVGRWSELQRVLALRGGGWASQARRSWRRHARRHWLAEQTISSCDLSGALLAFRRSVWQQIGPFDEGYRLYFEETDWLQRLARSGASCRYVPAAEAVHLYAQSTVAEGQAQSWFLQSNRRFRRRTYGPRFTRILERLGGQSSPPATAPQRSVASSARAAWLEVSPSPLGFPAAACRFAQDTEPSTQLPAEIRERLAPGTYRLRMLSEADRTLALDTLAVPP
ncbi:MAG: glycosyltransferase family 2 protein [Acidobacteriota bacterium]